MLATSISDPLSTTFSDNSHSPWKSGVLSDWEVVVRDRRFLVHRYVLGLGPRSSAYFYNQFHFDQGSALNQSVLELGRALLCTCSAKECCCPDLTVQQMHDIDLAVETCFTNVLEYMYEGSIEFSHVNIACLYALADFLQIPSLLSCMEDDLIDVITKQNVVDILMTAEKFRLHSGAIIRQCVELLAKSFSDLSFDEWSRIPPAWLREIFRHQECAISSEHIARCILRVIREMGSQMSSTDNLVLLLTISHYQFELPAPDTLYLLSLIQTFAPSDAGADRHVQALTALQERCCDMVAWKFHELPTSALGLLPVSLVSQLLDRDDLHVLSEDQVYDHICKFVELNPVLSNEEACWLWRTCRFTLLSAETLWRAQTSTAPKNLILVGAILAGAIHRNEPFLNTIPETVSGKLIPRRIVRPLAAVFAEIPDSVMGVLPDDHIVKHLVSNQFVTYPARGSVKCCSSLHSMSWRFKISQHASPNLAASSGQRFHLLIGAANNQGMAIGLVSAPKGNLRPWSTRLGSATTRSWALHCQTGKKMHNGKSEDYGLECADGDVIDMTLSYDEQVRGSLTFAKNGKSLGPAFTGIQGQVAPAITLFRRNQQISLTICRPAPF